MRLLLALALLAAGLQGCAPKSVTLTPEAAVQACEGPTALALRARNGQFQSLTLDPAATSRIERRATQVGRQPLALVVAGQGTAPVSYTHLTLPTTERV